MSVLVNISDVCSEIFAGGDAPKSNMSEIKTDEYKIPIFSNGEANDGLYGYTNFARVTQPSITVSARGTIGFVAVRSEPFVPIVRLISLTPIPEKIEIKYLYYALQNYKFDGSGTSIPQLTVPMLKKYSFPLPPNQQQLSVVAQLDKICNLISLRKQQLSKLDELVKARFVELFDGKYKTVKLGDVVKTTSGGTPSKAHPEYYENGNIPWLTSGEVNAGVITSVKNYITDLGMKNSSAKMVPANSVVIAMYGATAGVTGLIRLDTTTNQAVCSILPSERFVPEYLYYAVSSKKDWMISQCQGGGQPNISQGIIKNMDVIDAPIEEQIRFAAFVEQTDKSKLEIQKSLEKLETLKKALMQKYFG